MPLINKPDSSRDLAIFRISFFSSFEIINATPDPKNFLWIAASFAGAAAVNPNVIKTLLANDLSTFPIKGNPVFSNDLKSLHKNLLVALFYTIEFFIILYCLINHSQKHNKALKLAY